MLLYVKLLASVAFWGGTYIAGRLAAAEAGPLCLAFLRFAVASALLISFAYYRHGGMPKLYGLRGVRDMLILGATGVFSYNVLFFTALQTVDAGRASIITANNPIVVAIAAALFLKEPLTPWKFLGVVISILGTVVAISRGSLDVFTGHGLSWGDLALVGCFVSWAMYSVYGKAVMQSHSGHQYSALDTVTWSVVMGTILLFPFAVYDGLFIKAAHYSATVWLSAGYLGMFGTVLGFTWFYEAVQGIGATRAAVFTCFVPIVAILCGWSMLGEQLTLSLLVGTILVLSGVRLVNRA